MSNMDNLTAAWEPADPIKDLSSYLRDCLTIEPIAITEELIRMPSDLAYWVNQEADSRRAYGHARQDRKRLYADLWGRARQAFIDSGEKRPSNDMVENAVQNDDEYDAAMRVEIDSEVHMKRLSGIVDAVSTKRSMLLTLGSHIRVEMEGDAWVKKQVQEGR